MLHYIRMAALSVLRALGFVLECSQRFNRFRIKKGEQYCRRSRVELCRPFYAITVRFDESIRYQLDGIDGWDINKLGGYHEGFGGRNSNRVGFRYRDGALTLHPYVHSGGTNYGKQDPPGVVVQLGEEVDCYLRNSLDGSKYYLQIGDQHFEYPRVRERFSWLCFRAFPFFGGDQPAPQDLDIWIK